MGSHANPSQARILQGGIRGFTKRRSRHPLALPEQPFDAELLRLSPLYRRSRSLFLKKGRFLATLVTSPRTLSSPALLDQRIEYSPIESELIWAATDPIQKKDPDALLSLRAYSSSLFHEQSHRILWRDLPPPPRSGAGLRRYLNFAESLVIAADMALGDELGPSVAQFFYLLGVIYDPGTELRSVGLSRREYRNYLQAVCAGTYMALELYSDEGIERALAAQFPSLDQIELPRSSLSLSLRAARRAVRLDPQFITTTNEAWQRRFARIAAQRLARRGIAALEIPADPRDYRVRYLIAERWFEKLGL